MHIKFDVSAQPYSNVLGVQQFHFTQRGTPPEVEDPDIVNSALGW